MPEPVLEIEHAGALAHVWMNRPAVHNALNEEMIDALTSAFATLSANESVRIIVLSGRGKSFCAGADIESMKRQGASSFDDNLADARQLAALFHAIAVSPRPTIARVNGAAFGGALGLISASDIAIASNNAVFAASEVRLGIIPATIAPYVLRSIGPRAARRLFLTAERINAARAEKIGLVHESVEHGQLDTRIDAITLDLLAGAPLAQSAAKRLIDDIAHQPVTPELIEDTAHRIAEIRSTAGAREGLSAFLEKRPPSWRSEKP